MIDLKTLTDAELERSTDRAVKLEKDSVADTTRHFQEVYRRRSFLPRYPNMFEYLTRKHGFCNGSAQLRIGVIELIRQVPVAQQKIERGELSMTAAANIRTFLNAEKKAARPYSENAKIELLDACSGKTTREVQKEFVRRNPEIEKREASRYTSDTRVRIELSISDEAFKKVAQLQDLLSHVDSNMSMSALFERLLEDGVNKYSPEKRAERAVRRSIRNSGQSKSQRDSFETHGDSKVGMSSQSSSDGTEGTTSLHAHEVGGGRRTITRKANSGRYIPAREKHRVFNDGKGCSFVDASGHRCGSTRFLQLDHVEPFSQGGENSAENLRWICAQHNRYRWESRFN